ncbi:hypothetical protein LCGC14_2348720 [marine sediment metagenome]|uniref:Short-chain dehydrogenase/reductase SDR n=1 Tax=marine sediment metagenome TaxID=412755 RepID=A0A0F9C9P8_9ZZZZ
MGLLDGKPAIVTGSARGIGRAAAELLDSQGTKVPTNDLVATAVEAFSKLDIASTTPAAPAMVRATSCRTSISGRCSTCTTSCRYGYWAQRPPHVGAGEEGGQGGLPQGRQRPLSSGTMGNAGHANYPASKSSAVSLTKRLTK